MGNQCAVLVVGADPYGDRTGDFYLHPAASTQPELGTCSPMGPDLIVNPSRFQNDPAISRTFWFSSARSLQSAGDSRMMEVALKFSS